MGARRLQGLRRCFLMHERNTRLLTLLSATALKEPQMYNARTSP